MVALDVDAACPSGNHLAFLYTSLVSTSTMCVVAWVASTEYMIQGNCFTYTCLWRMSRILLPWKRLRTLEMCILYLRGTPSYFLGWYIKISASTSKVSLQNLPLIVLIFLANCQPHSMRINRHMTINPTIINSWVNFEPRIPCIVVCRSIVFEPLDSMYGVHIEQARSKAVKDLAVNDSCNIFWPCAVIFFCFLFESQYAKPRSNFVHAGTSIDQGIACVLMLIALVLTYLIHPLDATSPYKLFWILIVVASADLCMHVRIHMNLGKVEVL